MNIEKHPVDTGAGYQFYRRSSTDGATKVVPGAIEFDVTAETYPDGRCAVYRADDRAALDALFDHGVRRAFACWCRRPGIASCR
jgi:hypothetical protein